MHFDDPPRYPAKRTESPRGEFTIRQFFLPIRISGEEVWALLDTGANISIMPKTVANQLLPSHLSPSGTGVYKLADLVGVPYSTYKMNAQLLNHIKGTVQDLDLQPYVKQGVSAIDIQGVEFQVLQLTWPEIVDKLDPHDPISVDGDELNFVIFGLYGVLDKLSITIVGDNSIQVQPRTPK